MSSRERLQATVSGLGELDYLRQRQEVLVQAALELKEEEEKEEEQQQEEEEEERSSEEKLLEENVLLLRNQLNCLRRRDAGLISQFQELDRQISDLRLDSKASHDQLETDSRPSSGFYELSDGVSLSNSSNSVFSECFCSTAEADGRLRSADELASCLDCDGLVGGLCDDSSSSVRRSISAPDPASLDPASLDPASLDPASLDPASPVDTQSKYHCNLMAQNGSNVYRYPSPLHAVAVHSPVFLQMVGPGGHGGPGGPGGPGRDVVVEELKPESSVSASASTSLVSQSSSWPASSSSSLPPSYKRLDSYICSLLQRRAPPFRTSRPRTSISADPAKSILRQASLCVRQRTGSGFGTLRGSEFKPTGPTGGASAGGAAPSSQRQWTVDRKSEETQKVFPEHSVDLMQNIFRRNNKDSAHNQDISPSGVGLQRGSSVINQDIDTSSNTLPPASAVAYLRELGSPKANSSPKETKQPCCPSDADLLLKSPVIKTVAPKSHIVNAKCIPARRHTFKLRKGSKNVKTVRMKTGATMRTSWGSEHNEPPSERRGDESPHRDGYKTSRRLDDGGSVNTKVSKRAGGSHGASVLDKLTTSAKSSVQSGASRHHHHHHGHHHHHHHGQHHKHHHGHHKHHHHGRDQVVVVAKPKHKQNDYRQLRAIAEVPNDEAFRRAQRKELLIPSAAGVCAPPHQQVSSPYSCVAGSDSEYSAECASLFHSTIADSSEDERSNCTTNHFGDNESGEEEYAEESLTSDTEDSGGVGSGGMGRGRSQSGQEMTPPKAFVKIKASHHLKKKILRFRLGSLKLMTTV